MATNIEEIKRRLADQKKSANSAYRSNTDLIIAEFGNIESDLAERLQQDRDEFLKRRTARSAIAAKEKADAMASVGGVLSDKALSFLVSQSNIDAPTFTAIFAGYELARKSAEEVRIRNAAILGEELSARNKDDELSLKVKEELFKQQADTNRSQESALLLREDKIYGENVDTISEQYISDLKMIDTDTKSDDSFSALDFVRSQISQDNQAILYNNDESSISTSIDDSNNKQSEETTTQQVAIPDDEVDNNSIILDKKDVVIEDKIAELYSIPSADVYDTSNDDLVLSKDVIDYVSSIPAGTEFTVDPALVEAKLFDEYGLTTGELSDLTVDEFKNIVEESYSIPQ